MSWKKIYISWFIGKIKYPCAFFFALLFSLLSEGLLFVDFSTSLIKCTLDDLGIFLRNKTYIKRIISYNFFFFKNSCCKSFLEKIRLSHYNSRKIPCFSLTRYIHAKIVISYTERRTELFPCQHIAKCNFYIIRDMVK